MIPVRARAAGADFEGDAPDALELVVDRDGPGLVQRCACGGSSAGGECASCRRKRQALQRSATSPAQPAARTAPPVVGDALSTPGRPLDRATRASFEPRFGRSFGHVRVHDDAKAHLSARAIHARAYTVGRDVVFARGQYAPDTRPGRHLLAHELTHVVQQVSAPEAETAPQAKLSLGHPRDPSEREADRTADAVVAGIGRVPSVFTPVGAAVQRACGVAGIGAHPECSDRDPVFVAGHPVFQFDVNCDDLATGEEARLRAEAAGLPASGPIVIHGYASTDGDPDFNENLSCARASRAEAVLSGPGGAGIDPARITKEHHGPTPGPVSERRSVVIEASGPPPPAPPPTPPPLPLTVAFTTVRADTTPAGVPDRIPPRVDTVVGVGVVGWRIPMAPVTLSIEGAGGGNGTATIDGAATLDVTGSTAVNLRGVTQTDPGNAGNLRLVAEQGGTRLAASNLFTVSAIPQNFSITFNALITGARRGIRVNNHWQSDSGNVADLDEAERSEQVQYGAGSGIFAGVVGVNSGYLPADSPPTVDSHGVGAAALTGFGAITANQTFIFRDHRTGASDIPVRNSGFQIERLCLPVPGTGVILFRTAKFGATTSANGFASAAGAGSVARVQVV
jgi:outer membrane protein OmpA-like peptidoglycan-associated protein